MKIGNLGSRFEYYHQTLKSFHDYGGYAELFRGILRFVLRKPSDAIRRFRWKTANFGGNDERATLDFQTFKLMVDTRDEGISAELAVDHTHEPIGTAILRKILASQGSERRQKTVVDLGANIGYYAIVEASNPNVEQIIAIEPNPASFALLKENVAINGFGQKFSLHNVGISDIDGNLPFYISKQSNICSITPKDNYEKQIDIPVLRLDTLLEKEKLLQLDLIRMDIEGYEICVLRGMLQTIQKFRPWICMEYHSPMISAEDRESFISTFESLNYELKCFTFRWADYPIFGKTLCDNDKVIMYGNLRKVLNDITTQVLLIFLAPAEKDY